MLVLAASGGSGESLRELAAAEDWQRIVRVADLRAHQLPLSSDEAMVAAFAAARTGDEGVAREFFNQARQAPGLEEVATVEWAMRVIDDKPSEVMDAVLPLLRRSATNELRGKAIELTVDAVERGIDSATRKRLESVIRHVRGNRMRPIELALARSDAAGGRRRLYRLLTRRVVDEVGIEAARELMKLGDLEPREAWVVGRTLYRHAFYSEAEPLLEMALPAHDKNVPRWEVALTRGRCAFRRGRWTEAAQWYQKAIKSARNREDRAVLHVHLGRARELDGDVDGAVEAAIAAVRLKTTDERRLFLARLRLRQGKFDLAVRGVNMLRSRSNRDRGQVVLALDEIRRGENQAAEKRLQAIRRNPWGGPAAVLSARLAVAREDSETALSRLEVAAGALNAYWADLARTMMAEVPSEVISEWRERTRKKTIQGTEREKRSALIRLAVLEPDHNQLVQEREWVARQRPHEPVIDNPRFRDGIAGRLWNLGLRELAHTWDPAGFPAQGPSEVLWSASSFEEHGQPWRALSLADHAWRVAGSDLPVRVYTEELRSRLYPLPNAQLIREAASKAKISWSLLAGVVREESRWNPRALSRVGARGLAQLMPATAAAIAASLGEPEPTSDELFFPRTSLHLGAEEIARLLREFDGFVAPAIAAYNAGEVQARLWLESCGSNCTEERYTAVISFNATRRYTADVLLAGSVYDEMMVVISDQNGSPPDVPVLGRANARSRR
jgi:tetratricopeptide (TPR) repeat protein